MAKASFKLPDATEVTINGTPEEIQRVLAMYGAKTPAVLAARPSHLARKSSRRGGKAATASRTAQSEDAALDLNAIVRALKEWDKFEAVEKHILDKRSGMNRVLVAIYAAQKLEQAGQGLTSGEISTITRELNVPVSQPNVSRTLSGTAQGYVHGDTVRRKGQAVRYQLTRRGIQYVDAAISGKQDDRPGVSSS